MWRGWVPRESIKCVPESLILRSVCRWHETENVHRRFDVNSRERHHEHLLQHSSSRFCLTAHGRLSATGASNPCTGQTVKPQSLTSISEAWLDQIQVCTDFPIIVGTRISLLERESSKRPNAEPRRKAEAPVAAIGPWVPNLLLSRFLDKEDGNVQLSSLSSPHDVEVRLVDEAHHRRPPSLSYCSSSSRKPGCHSVVWSPSPC